MAVAAAIPWKEILKALPYVVSGAKAVLNMTAKTKQGVVDPHQDLREQVQTLSSRLGETESAQSEQAKILAQVAEQLQAVAIRSARGYWMAAGALGLSVLSLVITVVRT